MVQTDGRVTTCCLDEQLENVVGNVRDQPLPEIWSGPTMEAWRLAHIEGRFDESGPLCTRCNWRSAGAYPPDKVAEYLVDIRPPEPEPDSETR
jgi:radical SAM protein with 4Fe4S-binding SPASM domain